MLGKFYLLFFFGISVGNVEQRFWFYGVGREGGFHLLIHDGGVLVMSGSDILPGQCF